eukprot:284817609_5
MTLIPSLGSKLKTIDRQLNSVAAASRCVPFNNLANISGKVPDTQIFFYIKQKCTLRVYPELAIASLLYWSFLSRALGPGQLCLESLTRVARNWEGDETNTAIRRSNAATMVSHCCHKSFVVSAKYKFDSCHTNMGYSRSLGNATKFRNYAGCAAAGAASGSTFGSASGWRGGWRLRRSECTSSEQRRHHAKRRWHDRCRNRKCPYVPKPCRTSGEHNYAWHAFLRHRRFTSADTVQTRAEKTLQKASAGENETVAPSFSFTACCRENSSGSF